MGKGTTQSQVFRPTGHSPGSGDPSDTTDGPRRPREDLSQEFCNKPKKNSFEQTNHDSSGKIFFFKLGCSIEHHASINKVALRIEAQCFLPPLVMLLPIRPTNISPLLPGWPGKQCRFNVFIILPFLYKDCNNFRISLTFLFGIK